MCTPDTAASLDMSSQEELIPEDARLMDIGLGHSRAAFVRYAIFYQKHDKAMIATSFNSYISD